MLEVGREQGLLDRVGAPGAVVRVPSLGQVQQLVGRVRIGDDDPPEVVLEALARRDLRHVLEHLRHALGGHALALGQVLDLGALVVLGEGGVQLVAVPRDRDLVLVRELLECGFEAALADEAPRAGDIRPDVNVHTGFKVLPA